MAMCGITGFLTDAPLKDEEGRHHLRQMCDSLEHRGPDDFGYWIDADAGIALGHRRLSIVDLSVQGHQPMLSACGRFVIVYNGEIYNFKQLRMKLEAAERAPVWRGHSDTEILLAAIREWGVERTLRNISGMFAFALWDREERVLTLARDPLGEKPLYYGRVGNAFLFGSELKALLPFPGSSKLTIDRDALCLFMRYNSIPAPYSIYSGISKLRPGTVAKIRPGRYDVSIDSYWTLADAVARGRAHPFSGTADDAVAALDDLLGVVLGEQMIADVPLGAFLSGGIDSSTIVALMQAQATHPVESFTIGFDDSGYNEAMHARSVAQHLGTQHSTLYVKPAQALEIVPELPLIYDEPFADSSQIPTFLVSQMARRRVTVSLSGDGGDELFGGYNRYVFAQELWNKLGHVPMPARRLVANCIKTVREEDFDRIAAPLMGLMPAHRRQSHVGDKLHKFANVMTAGSVDALYRHLVSTFDSPERIVLGAKETSVLMASTQSCPFELGDAERMMYLDTLTYLPTDILTKVDRAAMRVSLETRVPFLDRRVVEFAWSLPMSMKVRDGQGKWLLRQLLYRYVPKELIERPKQGFSVPIAKWLRGELREWASGLLSSTRIKNDEFLDASAVECIWQQHLAGTHNWQHQLWSILMFQAWLEATRSASTPAP
jgi:asparagine synthase (glutamine-hydrolysing)